MMVIFNESYPIWKFPGYPQIIHFKMIFHHKPTILGTPIYGTPHIAIFDSGRVRLTFIGVRLKKQVWIVPR